MGLDMYLERQTFVPSVESKTGYGHPDLKIKVKLGFARDGKPEQYTFKSVSGIVSQVAYWRKANAIHKWFVDNCQDGIDECQRTWVAPQKLVELRELCKEVLANPDKASELLPTTDGFFFGSTDYDEYYFDDLKRTVEMLKDVDKDDELNQFSDYYYQSSW